MVDGVISVKWHSAGRCADMYPDLAEYNGEFYSPNWICPEVDTISVENNPPLYQYRDGQSFVLVVNNCTDAEKLDTDEGLSTYTTASCATPEEVSDNVKYVSFRSKVMT